MDLEQLYEALPPKSKVIISVMKTQNFLLKGCRDNLASMTKIDIPSPDLQQKDIVQDCPNVFFFRKHHGIATKMRD